MANGVTATKRGDFYKVVGWVGGEKYEAEIHASYVDGQPRDRAEHALNRAIEITAEYERGK